MTKPAQNQVSRVRLASPYAYRSVQKHRFRPGARSAPAVLFVPDPAVARTDEGGSPQRTTPAESAPRLAVSAAPITRAHRMPDQWSDRCLIQATDSASALARPGTVDLLGQHGVVVSFRVPPFGTEPPLTPALGTSAIDLAQTPTEVGLGMPLEAQLVVVSGSRHRPSTRTSLAWAEQIVDEFAGISWVCRSRAHLDDCLPRAALDRVESGDSIVEGRDVADVRP